MKSDIFLYFFKLGDSTVLLRCTPSLTLTYHLLPNHGSKHMKTRIKGLYAAGDGAGVSRGIVGAAATGIIAARDIIKKNK